MIQKKINFNINKVNHFIEHKFPKRIIGTNSNKVVLFLERKQQIEWTNKINNILMQVFNIKLIGFKFVEHWSKIVLYVKNNKNYSYDSLNIYRGLIETILNKLLKTKYYVALIDYNDVWKNSQIKEKEFHKIAMNVIKTEEKYFFPVLKKEARKKISIWAIQYQYIKINSSGNYATKKISVSYKK